VTDDFWTTAWQVADALERDPESRSQQRIAALLRDDYMLQRYAFYYRQANRVSWMDAFEEAGLFDTTPGLEARGGIMQASGWPVLGYLRNVLERAPDQIAKILARLDTNNWAVIGEALHLAAELPELYAENAILRVLRLWDRSATQWTAPDVLASAISKLGASRSDPSSLEEALCRVLRKLSADDDSQRYVLGEVVESLQQDDSTVADASLASAVEYVFEIRSALGGRDAYLYGLDETGRVDGDTTDILIFQWLRSTERELVAAGSYALLRRATRMLNSSAVLPRKMALHALGRCLSVKPSEPDGVRLLESVAQCIDEEDVYRELPELLRLFAQHFPLMRPDAQVAMLERLRAHSAAEDGGSRWVVRDWLTALDPYLGPLERQIRTELEMRLGPGRTTFDRPRVVGGWVGARSPVTTEELETLPLPDLLGLLSHVPSGPPPSQPWDEGPTAEGLARLLQPAIASRIDELWPHLATLAQASEDAVIIFYLAWGVRDAFAVRENRDPDRLEAVLGFLTALTDSSDRLQPPSGETRARDFSIARAAADLTETLGDWLVSATDTNQVLNVMRWLLAVDDPSPSDGSDGMDPPSRAINSVRGEALLGCLRMLSSYWFDQSDGSASPELRRGLEELLVQNVEVETSDAVLSCYGRYLDALVEHWPQFVNGHEHELLPRGDEVSSSWSAVFGAYVTFRGPHRGTAQKLRAHYELAIARVGDVERSYLAQHGDRLLQHLIALALPRADDSPEWEELLYRAMSAVDDAKASRAIADLTFAVERESLEVPATWTTNLVKARLRRPRDGSSRVPSPPEATALAKLLFACRIPPTASLGLVQSLVAAGAELELDEVVIYLMGSDKEHTHSGARLLELACAGSSLRGYLRHVGETSDLLRGYALESPQLAWSAVTALGRQGAFVFEDVARELAEGRQLS
jgi:hypothetical protein